MTTPALAFTREIPIRHRVDVLVAGGGPAGVTAAVAAARHGASVMIVEQTGALGGLGTSGLVPGFCTMTDGEHLLADGLGREVIDRLRARNGTGPDDRPERWWGIPFQAEALKIVYDEMVAEAGITLRLYTTLADVVMDNHRITTAVVCGRGGLYGIGAKVFVDATGDAMLSMLAGASWELGDDHGHTQSPTLVSLFTNVDWGAFLAFQKETGQGNNLQQTLKQAIDDGVFTYADMHHSGAWHVGHHMAGMNVNHVFGVNGTDDRQLTDATIEGRRLVQEHVRFYRQYVPGFEHLELATTGSLLGVRETRRVVGHYVLCADDFLAQSSFGDEIGRYNYPIDIHCSDPSRESYEAFKKEFTQEYRYKEGESYGIPYRSLVPTGPTNALVAGRCFSTDRKMQGSIRVMPCCFITGQAVGVAAAMCAAADTPAVDVDTDALRDRLRELGAYIP